jgi:phosphatidylinositol alpha-1,6-mannosyltransferase
MVGHDPRGAFIQRARALESEAFSGADLLLPVDHEQARILRDDYGVGDRRIQVIANAVDVEKLARLSEAPIERDAAEEPYFLVPRRLVAKNGVEFAIRALAHLGRPSVRLLIAGGGPLERSLRKLARQLGSADQVQFLGVVAREELFDLYHSAAAVIVPSIPAFGVVEATSFVVLEAMAVGVPVIASGIGGIHEIVVDWSQGFLVPPGDDAALTAAMRSTLEMNATARASLVSAARARVNDSFNLETWACKVLDAYRQALGGS